MRYRNLCSEPVDKNVIKIELQNTDKVGEFWIGNKYLIHHYFFVTKYIEYADIRKMFLRIESGEYGEFPVHENSIVIVDSDGKEHALHVEYRGDADQILKYVKEHFKTIEVGMKKL